MSGWGAEPAGIDPERVAELLVDVRGRRSGRRGSGYRVSASAVLTAAHVVSDAARVRVRFDADRPGEWLTDGSVAWSDATVDAAAVRITPRPQDEGRVARVGFGRVAERDVVLACSAMGFPRFKLRADPAHLLDDGSPSQYRDSVHAVGTIAVLSNRRAGTLEVTVSPPEQDPDPKRSPWEGMSGAPVWSAGRIIGLVAEHHRSDGLGRLAATRVDHWYEDLTPERLNQLRGLLGVPALAQDLVEIVPNAPDRVLPRGSTPFAQYICYVARDRLDHDWYLASSSFEVSGWDGSQPNVYLEGHAADYRLRLSCAKENFSGLGREGLEFIPTSTNRFLFEDRVALPMQGLVRLASVEPRSKLLMGAPLYLVLNPLSVDLGEYNDVVL
jgi:hypothetical protein